MKQDKKLKIVLMILIIVLISVISFGGIYVENKGIMENVMPDYLLSRDLKGYRRVELVVSEESNSEITDASNETTENSSVENTIKQENLTTDNYKEAKNIIEKRLQNMNVNDYIIRENEENGKIILELPENENTDKVIGNVYQQGKFEMIDNETNEVLLTNNDIKAVKSGYGTLSSGNSAIIINIEFNKDGTEKFKDITSKYTEVEEIVEEDGTEATEKKTKEVALKIDDTTILTTHFDSQITNGIMQLTMSIKQNATTEEIQEQLSEANNLSSLLDSGKLPLTYNVNQNKFVYSNISSNIIEITTVVMIIISIIGGVYFIVKYKANGLLGGLSLIGYIATLLFVIRYANVEVSASGIVAMIFSVILNILMVCNMLKKENVMDAIKEFTIILIPALIIAIIFTLTNLSVGALLFWAIIITLIYNLVITKTIIK